MKFFNQNMKNAITKKSISFILAALIGLLYFGCEDEGDDLIGFSPNFGDAIIFALDTATDDEVLTSLNAFNEEEETLTFSITEDDSGLFELNSSDLSLVAGASFPPGESTYQIAISVTDSQGNSDNANYTIAVLPNVAPTIIPSVFPNFLASEDIDDVRVIGTVVGSDENVGTVLTYSIITNSGSLFEIDPNTGEISLAAGQSLDFGTASSHTITVGVSDGALSDTGDVIIQVIESSDPNDFVIRWGITTAGEGAIISFVGAVNCTIDWGDGTVEMFTSASNNNHNYATPGIYVITISGTYHNVRINNTEAPITVEQWGTNQWGSMQNMFDTARNVIHYAMDVPDLSNVTSFFRIIRNSNFEDRGNMANWDVSNVTIMAQSFINTGRFNADLSNWDVGNVITFANCFRGASSFNSDISGWDTSSAVNMVRMFLQATSFSQDLSGWDVSNVTNAVAFGDGSGLTEDQLPNF